MNNTNNDIRDDEIRVIGGSSERYRDNNKRWWWINAAFVGVIILVALCAGYLLMSDDKPTETEEPIPTVTMTEADELTQIEPAYTEVCDTIVNDIELRIYHPHHAKASLMVGAYDKQDTAIVLIAQAADIRADNGEIAGSFVLDGKVLAEGSSKEGFCAIIGNQITVGVAKNSSLFEKAINEGGSFFRQWSLVSNGVMIDDNPKGKSIRRALCQRGDDVFVIESQDKESFHDFAQALADMKVQNAIYLVGSIAYGWAKDQNGNRIEFGVESTDPTQQNRSYIVWR